MKKIAIIVLAAVLALPSFLVPAMAASNSEGTSDRSGVIVQSSAESESPETRTNQESEKEQIKDNESSETNAESQITEPEENEPEEEQTEPQEGEPTEPGEDDDEPTEPEPEEEPALTITTKESGIYFKLLNSAVPENTKKICYETGYKKDNSKVSVVERDFDEKNSYSTLKLNYKRLTKYGVYSVRALAIDKKGCRTVVGTGEFRFDKPSAEEVKCTTDNTAGTFRITAKGIEAMAGIQKVQAEVWTQDNKSDLKVLKLKKKSSGNYSGKFSISKFDDRLCRYYCRVCLIDGRGTRTVLKELTFRPKATCEKITVSGNGGERYYTVTAQEVQIPKPFTSVKFAVWCGKNNCTPIWYTARGKNGSDFQATIDIKKHKKAGDYTIRAYVFTKDGNKYLLAENTELKVNSKASAEIEVKKVDENAGMIKTAVHIKSASSKIAKVEMKVWCHRDKSDLYTYTAEKSKEDTYTVPINVNRYHNGTLGRYKMEVYVTFANGIRKKAGELEYKFSPKDYLAAVGELGSGSRTLVYKNGADGAKNVKFQVWSDTNGKDDLRVIHAKKSGSNWKAELDTSNLKHLGEVHLQVRVDGKIVKTVEFRVNSKDVCGCKVYVPAILQNPELPTGCESVALTIALAHYGYNLPKTTIADAYLPYSYNVAVGFPGNPYTYEGEGCFPPAIITAANSFLKGKGSALRARDLTGTKLTDLYSYIREGYPIIIWGTMYMREPNFTGAYGYYRGKSYPWYGGEHCMVLYGYNNTRDTVLISDPLEGYVERSRADFERLYNITGQYAVIIS